MGDEIRRIFEEDLQKTAREAATRAQLNAPRQNAPITEIKAARQPSIKETSSGYYNPVTGTYLVHPLNLMTLMVDESPWVDFAMRVIGAACSSTVPLFRITTDCQKSYRKKRQQEIDKIAKLLRFPNLHQTGYELFRNIFENMVLYGNAFVQVIKSMDGGIHSMYTLPPETVRAVPYFDEYDILHFAYVQIGTMNSPKVFLEDEIIHFKTGNSKSFVYGKPLFLSQLVQVASNISAGKAIASWFDQGFVGGAIFKMDSDPDVAERNRAFLREFYTKPENFGRTMLLEGDMEMIKDGNKFESFDFSKLSATDRDNILTAAGIPLSQAGVRSGEGNANAEIVSSEESAFLRNTVTPFHNMVYEKLTSKLFRQILKWDDVEIGPGVPVKFSMKDSIETVRALSSFGIQVNEARDLLSCARVADEEAGKRYLIQTNNGVIEASKVIGVDLNTGEEVETIFDMQASGAEGGGVDKAKQFSGANGLGGDLKKLSEKKKVDKTSKE